MVCRDPCLLAQKFWVPTSGCKPSRRNACALRRKTCSLLSDVRSQISKRTAVVTAAAQVPRWATDIPSQWQRLSLKAFISVSCNGVYNKGRSEACQKSMIWGAVDGRFMGGAPECPILKTRWSNKEMQQSLQRFVATNQAISDDVLSWPKSASGVVELVSHSNCRRT